MSTTGLGLGQFCNFEQLDFALELSIRVCYPKTVFYFKNKIQTDQTYLAVRHYCNIFVIFWKYADLSILYVMNSTLYGDTLKIDITYIINSGLKQFWKWSGGTVSLGPIKNMKLFHLFLLIKNETVSSVPLDNFQNCFNRPPTISWHDWKYWWHPKIPRK